MRRLQADTIWQTAIKISLSFTITSPLALLCYIKKLEPFSRKKQKPACCKPSSNLSVISIISLILLCPVFIQFREAWWKSSRFTLSIFNTPLSLETVWQTPADWPVLEEKWNSEPVIKRDIHHCVNSELFQTFNLLLVNIWLVHFACPCAKRRIDLSLGSTESHLFPYRRRRRYLLKCYFSQGET